MNAEKLKKITLAANEAVKDLDPDLKKVAFESILNRMLDNNFGTYDSNKDGRSSKSKPKKKSKFKRKGALIKSNEFDATTRKLIEGINRTKYPYIFDLRLALDKSLYILQIAKDDLKIDNLVPSQIAKLLNENFRIKATPSAIGMALMKAVKYVDRKPISIQGGAGYTYKIMHEGEKYLENIIGKEKSEENGN